MKDYDLIPSILKKEGARIFGETPPLNCQTKASQEQLLAQWKTDINAVNGITATSSDYYRQHLIIRIEIPATHINDVELELYFDGAGDLYIKKKRWPYNFSRHISGVELLEQYAIALKKASLRENKKYAKYIAKAHKREKIKSLKRQAIISKLEELCKAENIEHDIHAGYHYKLKLIAYLSKKYRIEVDIPYKNYQTILQSLPTTLKSLQTLTASGMVFRMKSRY